MKKGSNVRKKRRNHKKIIKIGVILFLIASIAAIIFFLVINQKLHALYKMNVDEMISYTTKDKESALITIGIIHDGKMEYTVYGSDAKILPQKEYLYEIGSITKTLTSSLLCKAIDEDKVHLEDHVNDYLNLPKNNHYPTLKQLVTHTSGYKSFYFEKQMMTNFFHGEDNDFYGIDHITLKNRLFKVSVKDKTYPFCYSNFNMAVVGLVLEEVYQKDYPSLMKDYIQNELKLPNTKISDGTGDETGDGTGDLSGYWRWKLDDAYLPAGAILSTISDMMRYVTIHMSNELPYLALGHNCITNVNANTKQNEKMGIRIDSLGIGWIMDDEKDIIWHNGGTSNFNSYLAFDKEKQIGVVVLSNLSPKYRIPATVVGVKLMEQLQNTY